MSHTKDHAIELMNATPITDQSRRDWLVHAETGAEAVFASDMENLEKENARLIELGFKGCDCSTEDACAFARERDRWSELAKCAEKLLRVDLNDVSTWGTDSEFDAWLAAFDALKGESK